MNLSNLQMSIIGDLWKKMWMYSHICQVEEQHYLSHLLTLTWSPLRYAHPGDPPAGHTAHAGQRAAALLLCLLHIWHRGRPALGRPPQKPLLCGRQLSHVSILFSSQYLIHVFVRRYWSAWWLGCSLFCFVLFPVFLETTFSAGDFVNECTFPIC